MLFFPTHLKLKKKVFLPAVCERAGGGAGTMSVQEKQGRVSRNREHEDVKVQQREEGGRVEGREQREGKFSSHKISNIIKLTLSCLILGVQI